MRPGIELLMGNRTSVPTQHCSPRMTILVVLFMFKHEDKNVMQATRGLTEDEDWCVENGDVLSRDEADRILCGCVSTFESTGLTYLAR